MGGSSGGMGPGSMGSGSMGPGGGSFGSGSSSNKPILDADGNEIPAELPAPRCDFVVQFAWKPRFEKDGGKAMVGGIPILEATGDAASNTEVSPDAAPTAPPSNQEN